MGHGSRVTSNYKLVFCKLPKCCVYGMLARCHMPHARADPRGRGGSSRTPQCSGSPAASRTRRTASGERRSSRAPRAGTTLPPHKHPRRLKRAGSSRSVAAGPSMSSLCAFGGCRDLTISTQCPSQVAAEAHEAKGTSTGSFGRDGITSTCSSLLLAQIFLESRTSSVSSRMNQYVAD